MQMTEGTQNPTATTEELPPAQRHIIKRPRLTKLLDETDARVILLVAPAGYGKTTLAREWLGVRRRQMLTYRARSTVDPTVVAEGIAEALAPLSSAPPTALHEFLTASSTPDADPDVLAEVVTQDCHEWPARTWLVIDDYHTIMAVDACERVIARCVEILKCNVLVASRSRPSWVTSRSLLYGQVVEYGAETLAMTVHEAEMVRLQAGMPIDHVMESAHGWPAVIGLATLSSRRKPTIDGVPQTLYDYLADELYEKLSPETKESLVLLSFATSIDRRAASHIFGTRAETIIREGMSVGLMTVRDDEFEIHPLVRAFLKRKIPDVHNQLEFDRLLDFLIANESWDDAFAVVSELGLREKLPTLVGVGAQRLLAAGRVATVEKWILWGQSHDVAAPELLLARAEVYHRRGDWQLAEQLALSAARSGFTDTLRGRALIVAGQAAHLLDEHARAAEHFERALELNTDADVTRRGTWGRFIATFLADAPQRQAAFDSMAGASDATPTHVVRLNQARLLMSLRDGSIDEAAAACLTSEPLLLHVDDPLVRTGFLNNLADALVVTALYDDATRVAELELQEAKRFRLGFVMPNALLNLAGAKLGLGGFTPAAALADQACADAVVDPFVRANAHALKIRIALARNDARSIDRLLMPQDWSGVRHDILGEVFACMALAEALRGDQVGARRHYAEAAELSFFATTRALLAATDAALALGSRRPVLTPTLIAFGRAVEQTGAMDCAILLFRASRDLLEKGSQVDSLRPLIATVVQRSQDSAVATIAGVRLIPRQPRSSTLSKRELEILGLVAQGFRNADVARRLVISPKTVKTHLQHIYEKLDVRSRTEAAIKAKEAGLLN